MKVQRFKVRSKTDQGSA